jgi:hypothetical protein
MGKRFSTTGTAVESESRTVPALNHGSEVEDDLQVQSTVVELLAGLGYVVLKANNAERYRPRAEHGAARTRSGR